MKTIGDAVLEHVKQCENGELTSTRQAILALELPDDNKYNTAGNFYLAALFIISKMQKQIMELENGN